MGIKTLRKLMSDANLTYTIGFRYVPKNDEGSFYADTWDKSKWSDLLPPIKLLSVKRKSDYAYGKKEENGGGWPAGQPGLKTDWKAYDKEKREEYKKWEKDTDSKILKFAKDLWLKHNPEAEMVDPKFKFGAPSKRFLLNWELLHSNIYGILTKLEKEKVTKDKNKTFGGAEKTAWASSTKLTNDVVQKALKDNEMESSLSIDSFPPL